jgi:NAD(P)-dependent dehydrogenase (short-subunit alcohol dehydrogenase family)
LSSCLHRSGDPSLADLRWERRAWDGPQVYADSKLFVVQLAFAVGRRWPGVRSNAVNPGWVPTKMGGPDAPDDLGQGADTQVWLAVAPDADTTGGYFFHLQPSETHAAAHDERLQDELLEVCAELSGERIVPRRSDR